MSPSIRTRFRRAVFCALPLIACYARGVTPTDIRPTANRADSLAAAGIAPEDVGVFASRNALRVVFAREAEGPRRLAVDTGGFQWSMWVDGIGNEPRMLHTGIMANGKAVDFGSLRDLAAHSSTNLCVMSIYTLDNCVSTGARSAVIDGRVVLVLEDSAAVGRLLVLRPDSAALSTQFGPDSTWRRIKVPIHYISPEIPRPDSAARAEFARRSAVYEKSVRRVTWRIGTVLGRRDTLVLTPDDTATIALFERRCRLDMCAVFATDATSQWDLSDSSLVDLTMLPGYLGRLRLTQAMRVVHAKRVGTNVVSATGIAPRGDTLPVSAMPPTRLSFVVIVIPHVGRIELAADRDTVISGSDVRFRAKLFDRAGNALPDVPIPIHFETWALVSGGSVYPDGVGVIPASVTFDGITATTKIVVVPRR